MFYRNSPILLEVDELDEITAAIVCTLRPILINSQCFDDNRKVTTGRLTVPRDYRVMLLLAAICGLSTLIGFLVGRAGIRGEFIAPSFAVAYVTGGWFATQDVWHALKCGKIDIQFLTVAAAGSDGSVIFAVKRECSNRCLH